MRESPPSNTQFLQSRAVSGLTFTTILLSAVVVAALYFGREVFMPIALAVLLSFLLAPAVRLLRRCYLPRTAAVFVVSLLAFAAIIGLGVLMVAQVTELASELPRYQSTLREKIQNLRGAAAGNGVLERASEVLQDLREEIDLPNGRSRTRLRVEGTSPDRPIAVEVRQPESALHTLAAFITLLISPLATMGIVAIFLIFILLQREDLRNRFVRLVGAQDLQRTTAALDDAGRRLSRLFLTQLALNAFFGVVIGLGLWIVGLPSAPLWGMLAMIMRFVPYIGALIAAVFPLMLAAAVGPDWTLVLCTGALFLVVEPIVGHVIEPLAYGHNTGLSPVAVITSATIWTWLWGPIGLVLATPLTVCLVVLGRHVDRWKFLELMLGDQSPLTPVELLYQRLLARDPVEAAEQARMYLKDKPLIAYYDDILLNGLKLAESDEERGMLDDARMQLIRDGVAEIVDDLGEHEDKRAPSPNEDDKADGKSPFAKLDKAEGTPEARMPPERWRTENSVLCVPGLGLLDEGVAMIVAHLLKRRGIGARAEQADALSMSRVFSWDTKDAALVCLCYVENVTAAQIRYAVRRIRRRDSNLLIVIALLGDDGKVSAPETEMVSIQNSLRATLDKIVDIAHGAPGTEASTERALAEPAAVHGLRRKIG